MLKKILGAIVILLAGFAVVVAMQPAEFRITRTVTIAAPAEQVFPLVNDLRRSAAWSPWEKLDPAMKRTYEGPAAGVGAAYAWDGNDKVGAGRLRIVESEPNARVKMQLSYTRPFEGVNTTELVLRPQGGTTQVEWSLNGTKGFIQKGVCMFVSMDKMVGPDFEKGLGQLKSLAEAPAGGTSSAG